MRLRKAVESYSEDLKVVILGTGGMSHQLQGERAGLIDVDFDLETMDRIASDPEWLTQFSNAEIMRRTGTEGIETIMWLVMRGALQDNVKVDPQALPRADLQHRRGCAGAGEHVHLGALTIYFWRSQVRRTARRSFALDRRQDQSILGRELVAAHEVAKLCERVLIRAVRRGEGGVGRPVEVA